MNAGLRRRSATAVPATMTSSSAIGPASASGI